MTKKIFCLSSMADGEAILHNGTSSNETPRSLLSNKTPGSKDPSSLDNRPPVQTNADEPGRNNKSNTHIAGAGTPSSSSSNPASAPLCCCDVLLAYEPYSQGPDHDPAEWFRRCPIHEKDDKRFWLFIDTLEDFDDAMRSARLTPEGKAFRSELLQKNSEVEVKINPHGGRT